MSTLSNDDGLASLQTPFETEAPKTTEQKENFKGVVTAGWILAIVLPFLGIFLNTWLVKNADKYEYSKVKAIIPLVVSIALSSVLLLLCLPFVLSFAGF